MSDEDAGVYFELAMIIDVLPVEITLIARELPTLPQQMK